MSFQRKDNLTDLVHHTPHDSTLNNKPQGQSQPAGTVIATDGTLVTLGLNQGKSSSDISSK